MAEPRFTLVEDSEAAPAASAAPTLAPSPDPRTAGETSAATKILLLSLAALSKRFVIALADLFGLITVASVFWLWHSTPDPNVYQLVQLFMYAAFVTGLNLIIRRA